ncbi:hypothetical protein HCU01_01240 [Halomonas cupida]|uniref:Phage terminase, small subunit, putative, P27 family n=1 Tax=Halomonas cupida TaxID=44933 RepID=A0A1M7B1K9_9GAMM|nr:P27 family phage terminase small subunit [Halomonas cupida]GEN22175.1 hypothetical protein HCU01_01240 [Halomonas cupida]SHL48892.1 phage terminase, small subunit, putative, P27 family [Halomonas cupida]
MVCKKPPSKLSTEARRLYTALATDYDITDEAGLALLRSVAESRTLIDECQKVISAEGITYLDRYGQPKPHPLLAVSRDARGQMMSALKALNLDLEPLRDAAGRPPTLSTVGGRDLSTPIENL